LYVFNISSNILDQFSVRIFYILRQSPYKYIVSYVLLLSYYEYKAQGYLEDILHNLYSLTQIQERGVK